MVVWSGLVSVSVNRVRAHGYGHFPTHKYGHCT